jgi:hypothetical protein
MRKSLYLIDKNRSCVILIVNMLKKIIINIRVERDKYEAKHLRSLVFESC